MEKLINHLSRHVRIVNERSLIQGRQKYATSILFEHNTRGTEVKYHKSEKLALDFVAPAKKSRQYFLTHPIEGQMNQPIKHMLKQNLTRRMTN
jgi:hypothetical protein